MTFVRAHLVPYSLKCVISGIPSSYNNSNTSNHHKENRLFSIQFCCRTTASFMVGLLNNEVWEYVDTNDITRET